MGTGLTVGSTLAVCTVNLTFFFSVGTFATATGVGVKPTKSYVYTNCEGPPLTITTYEQNNTNYTLQNKKTSTLKQLLAGDYFRHLGNIQNAKGDTPIKSTKMYDESTQDNILTKVTNNMNAANMNAANSECSDKKPNTLPHNVREHNRRTN